MAVIIDKTKYYSIDEIREILGKTFHNEKIDCFNDDEINGVEWAEHAIMIKLQELEKNDTSTNEVIAITKNGVSINTPNGQVVYCE